MSISELKNLDGKVVVITGASRGIGRALALAAAQQGAVVGCIARNGDDLKALSFEMKTLAGRAAYIETADVSNYGSISMAVNKLSESIGEIDTLVVNAGIMAGMSPVLDYEPSAWSSMIDVNLKGAFNTVNSASKYLRKGGATKIIMIGSGVGHRGAKNNSAYACSKAGTWMLTKILSEELKEEGIAVNELIPGPVKTSMNPGASGPMWKEPEEIVPLFLFLLMQGKNGPTGQSFSLARTGL